MTVLVLQLDLRLRKLTPEGLDDVVGTFTHYDLPLDAAANDWTPEERAVIEAKVLRHFGDMIPNTVVGLLDHCRWEQAELPFG
ncbi:MAG: hypothetical protein ACOYD4_18485 [Solirubrobacterales bacterium]